MWKNFVSTSDESISFLATHKIIEWYGASLSSTVQSNKNNPSSKIGLVLMIKVRKELSIDTSLRNPWFLTCLALTCSSPFQSSQFNL
jgi:hypothetical protein